MVTLYLRQDADENNVIPARFIDKKAESIAQKVGYGSLVYVAGEHRVLTEKIYEQNEDGVNKLDADGKPVPVLGADGRPLARYHSAISIRHPAYPDSKDITFLDSLDKAPQWFVDMNLEMKARAERSREMAANKGKDAPQDQSRASDKKKTSSEKSVGILPEDLGSVAEEINNL